MNKLILVVVLFAVLQATNCSPAKRNWDKEEDYADPPTEVYFESTEFPTQNTKEEDKEQLRFNKLENDYDKYKEDHPLKELKDKYDQDKDDEDKQEEIDDLTAEVIDMEEKHEDESPKYGSQQDIVEGDIKLTPVEAAIFKESGWDGLVKSEAWMRNHGVWPTTIPYNISGIRSQEERALNKSIDMLHRYTCLRFVRRTTQRDYLQFVNRGGCWSYLGKIRTGPQQISLGPGCGAAVPVHEIMHALGRFHEQSRSDRDTYVRVNFTNIHSRYRGNFNKQTTSDNQSLPYDYSSLMHYGPYGFAINRRIPTITPLCPGAKIGQRSRLSMLDMMHINIRYCPGRVVRLVNGSSPNEGRVEVYWEKEWGTVCDDDFGQADGDTICRYLGYARARIIRPNAHFGQGSGPIWFDNMRCTGTERSPFHCLKNMIGSHNCGHHEDAGVVCQNTTGPTVPTVRPADAVRLVNGTTLSRHAGRVEVFVNGRWGTVCDDSFGVQEAQVICRQLGYCNLGRARAYSRAHFGQGTVPILIDDLQCTGRETDIRSCQSRRHGTHNCGHYEDAGVSCM